ncbi:MAG: hypothetical protein EBQ66_10780 [Flavobacteriia bacterium]|jgi:hypothetical protein|nr:hypothetical protein [Flavobacteriia bacterium]
MKSFEPEVWGPHYWFFMMTLALSYPERANAVTKRKYYDFVLNLPIFIPDPEIGNRFSGLLDKYPVSPYLDGRDSFIRWVHFIHNKVNHSLGKEEISLTEALENYYREYTPRPVVTYDNLKWKKYAVIGVFIFILLFIIYLYR